MKNTTRLRQLLAGEDMVILPGAYDGLTARLVEQAGYAGVYMTGAGTSAAHGFPDFGLLTMTEMADNAGVMARSVDIPVIADADTGYGNELNVTRTVREFESRGVAGIHLEDQVTTKRCGHLDGKEIIAKGEFIDKIKAALNARQDPDFVIIARTDARAVNGLDDAIDRANAALEAGADLAFVEAPESLEELAAVTERVQGPCLLNMVPGGKTPSLSFQDAQALGFRMMILPGALLQPILLGGDAALKRLRDEGGPTAPSGADAGVREFFRRFGADQWSELSRSFQKQDVD